MATFWIHIKSIGKKVQPAVDKINNFVNFGLAIVSLASAVRPNAILIVSQQTYLLTLDNITKTSMCDRIMMGIGSFIISVTVVKRWLLNKNNRKTLKDHYQIRTASVIVGFYWLTTGYIFSKFYFKMSSACYKTPMIYVCVPLLIATMGIHIKGFTNLYDAFVAHRKIKKEVIQIEEVEQNYKMV